MGYNTNKKEEILLNAMQAFTLKGFEDTKMHCVADVSDAPLYILLELFEDKTGMYKQCLEYAEGILNNNNSCKANRILAKDFCKSCRNKKAECLHLGINPFMPLSFI